MISKIRGVRDKFAGEFSREKKIKSIIQDWLHLANFSEVATPILEKTDLYFRAVGAETDIVSKEMFLITPRTEESDSICLRPELTASLFRAFLEEEQSLNRPWKVFTIGPCFRYERPQKGRLREFNQASIELINTKSIHSLIELIILLDRLFSHQFRIANYSLKINSLGRLHDRQKYREALLQFLSERLDSICFQCQQRMIKNPLRCLDCKSLNCQQIYLAAPKMLDSLCESSAVEFAKTKELLELASVNFLIDDRLVRGLDYYDGVVFEFVSLDLGSQNTFCGGGEYALGNLFDLKDNYHSVGAGIGIERLAIVLENSEVLLTKIDTLVCILPLKAEFETIGQLLLDFLRKEKVRCEFLADEGLSIKQKMKFANKLAADIVIFIGDDEVSQNYFTVKNMNSGEEAKVSQQNLLVFLRNFSDKI